jgi:hypothetical protein
MATKLPGEIRVTNLTDAPIDLPPVPATADNPKGWPAFVLIPGGNNVPSAYVEALRTHEVVNAFGQRVKPGLAALEKLSAPQTKWAHTQFPNGKIRFETDPKATLRKQGKEPPRDLRTTDQETALDHVARERSTDVLESWLVTENRTDVVAALQARIAKLS